MADLNGPVCPNGHANPTGAVQCQVCGAPLTTAGAAPPSYPPPGAPPAPPTGTAASVTGPASATAVGPAPSPLVAGFGQTLRARPALSVVGVLAANAGALVVAAAFALIEASSDDPGSALIIGVGVALLLVGWFVGGVLTVLRPGRAGGHGARLAEFVPGATLLAAGGVLLVVIGLVNTSLSDSAFDGPDQDILWWPFLAGGLILLALWVLPGLQGRPFLLGAALLSFLWAVTAFVGVKAAESESSRYEDAFQFGLFSGSVNDVVTKAAGAALVYGMVCLLAVIAADRFGLRGVATPVLVTGIVGAIVGAYGVVRDQDLLPALLLTGVIVVILAVGALGGRRATTWFGAVVLTPAILQLIVASLDGEVEPVPFLLLALVAAVVIAMVAAALFVWGGPAGRTLDAQLPGERRFPPPGTTP